MEELTKMLNKISDSYFDFVLGITQYAKVKPERLEKVTDFLKNNPSVTSSDVVEFVMKQDDFMEDMVVQKVS